MERCSAQYGKNIKGITRRAQSLLYRHGWPGNVRELENVVAHACMMADGHFIDITELPEGLFKPRNVVEAPNSDHSLAEMERLYVRQVVARFGGNKLRAAEVLKISRGTLYRLLSDGNYAAPKMSGADLEKHCHDKA